jgi:hypothetical protein
LRIERQWFADNDDRLPSQTFKGSLSYVTGSHNFKVGTQLQRGHFERRDTNHAQGDYYIVSLDGAPLLATISSPLAGWVEPVELQPRDLRAGFVDDETPDPERGAFVSTSRTIGGRLSLWSRPVAAEPERQLPGIKNVPTGRT